MSHLTVLVVPADETEPVYRTVIDGTLESYQGLVGGLIEAIGGQTDYRGHPWHGYVNEEGKLQDLPVNPRATLFMCQLSSIFPWDYVSGQLILVGEGFTSSAGSRHDDLTSASGDSPEGDESLQKEATPTTTP
jgi:hypothetical protein